ncbi:DUF5518 domain-containing protein [Halobaculum gomorrense]|uniref:DUF5518 domain-containing protein n=1 Tax=Halobaculum gomorrense TaxID=43928 RepID=A0A1M5SUH0_9EURY|nr:DUF5518 domain-containing protein [Halobaculum gomorrense]SHH41898.1 hypothetical protein SAMN05443636_2517 [Halobaculum gomorrense]
MSSSASTTLKHATIGAAVSLATFFLPFSPMIGGGVAGYLHGPDRAAGAKVGGLSGLLAAIPGAVLVTLFASIFVIVGPGQRSSLLVALLFTALYGVALGAAAGFVGALLNEEFAGPTETDPVRLRGDRDATAGSTPDSGVTEFEEPVDGFDESASV